MSTLIEWATDVWNPTTGCSEISPGCARCYARKHAERLQRMGAAGYDRGFEVAIHPDRLDKPLRVRKPQRWFVNSMSDLFHEQIPGEFVARVWDVMRQAHWHTFLVLTKRADRMADIVPRLRVPSAPNIWLGVTVENAHFLDRLWLLLQTPAAVRFASFEPLLGPLLPASDEHRMLLEALDWAIIGGESGHGARAMEIEWARALLDTLRPAGVACFVKQLGAAWVKRRKRDARPLVLRLHPKGGDPHEWPEDLRVRDFPRVVFPVYPPNGGSTCSRAGAGAATPSSRARADEGGAR